MSHLQPLDGIWLVTQAGARWLEPLEISPQVVGAKAFGLITIPRVWTLPFFVIASDLFGIAKQSKGDPSSVLTGAFLESLFDVAKKTGIQTEDRVLLRSSAVTENVEEKGKFWSEIGPLNNIAQIVRTCCVHLTQDPETARSTICFIVQKHANPLRLRGHLSNERRLAKETRDWVYELEDVVDGKLDEGQIAIRPWREGKFGKTIPLVCQYEVSVARTLREPARWAYSQAVRIHFEWVWDGEQLYLVQADPTPTITGSNPRELVASIPTPLPDLNLRAFRPVTAKDGKKFPKVQNVLIYGELGIPTATLFILDDPDILKELATGVVPKNLLHDLALLTKRSLVLRTDLSTDNLESKQMLPRSDEVRSVEQAAAHLTTTLQKTKDSGCSISQLAVLAHHFIPAVTSAWSYAEPRLRKVLIEALWGIPEGLYYYSHDTFEVDTLRANPKQIVREEQEKFSIVRRHRYKHHFVAPTSAGEWRTHVVAEPFDWRPSISQDKWIKQIGYQSRLIADYMGQPVNIMWFVDLAATTGLPKVLPWYHELASEKPKIRRGVGRKKFVTDRDQYIETANDIEKFERSAHERHLPVKRIRIRPRDAKLLREKEFPKQIGELAKKLNAVIVLEGGLLSHAYYILRRTGAQVETVDNFVGDDDIRDYEKLVRDLIPKQIAGYGEKVTVTRLKGDELIRALRTKLVEEAIEALDASGYDSLIEELADVLEVIDSLRERVKLKKTDLESKQQKKRQTKGSFVEGYVLLETRNPSITEDFERSEEKQLLGEVDERESGITEVKPTRSVSDILQRSIDRRQQGEATESMLTVEVPLVADKWEATTGELPVSDGLGTTLRVRSRIVGKRNGSVLRLELSVITTPSQLPLPLETPSKTKE